MFKLRKTLHNVNYYDVFKKVWKNEITSIPRRFYENAYWKNITTDVIPDMFSSECGFYSYTRFMNSQMKESSENLWIGRMPIYAARYIIPKGSRYYVSDDANVYVSDTLVLDDIIMKL